MLNVCRELTGITLQRRPGSCSQYQQCTILMSWQTLRDCACHKFNVHGCKQSIAFCFTTRCRHRDSNVIETWARCGDRECITPAQSLLPNAILNTGSDRNDIRSKYTASLYVEKHPLDAMLRSNPQVRILSIASTAGASAVACSLLDAATPQSLCLPLRKLMCKTGQ